MVTWWEERHQVSISKSSEYFDTYFHITGFGGSFAREILGWHVPMIVRVCNVWWWEKMSRRIKVNTLNFVQWNYCSTLNLTFIWSVSCVSDSPSTLNLPPPNSPIARGDTIIHMHIHFQSTYIRLYAQGFPSLWILWNFIVSSEDWIQWILYN